MSEGLRIPATTLRPSMRHAQGPRFSARMIDAHTHLGQWTPDKADFKVPTLSRALDQLRSESQHQNEVAYALVSSLTCIDKAHGKAFSHNELEGGQLLLEECQKDKRLKPLIVCQPGQGDAANVQNLLKTHRGEFYGFKFHTMGLGLPANDRRYHPYMKLAQDHSLPCVFHTDQSGSFGDPKLIYDLAKKFPKVPVVLYHMSLAPGGQVKALPASEIKARQLQGLEENSVWDVRERWHRDGINVVKEALTQKDANLFLEVSWVKPETVVEAIKTVGADRVLYGSDAPLGDFGKEGMAYRQNIEAIQKAIRQSFPPQEAEKVIQKVFYDNAYQLFFQQRRLQNAIPPAGASSLPEQVTVQEPQKPPSPPSSSCPLTETSAVPHQTTASTKSPKTTAKATSTGNKSFPTWAKWSLGALPVLGGGGYLWYLSSPSDKFTLTTSTLPAQPSTTVYPIPHPFVYTPVNPIPFAPFYPYPPYGTSLPGW